ncbi:MAG: SUMF1/EgtB/PvdO family nonheme iron enzyme [Planctomycetota bacterium]|jgi:formylglycine-generating enzyme required for sulfatase activity
MSRTLLSFVMIVAVTSFTVAHAQEDEAAKKKALADYRAAMKEGRKAQKNKDWKAAVAAYKRALEAKPGDRSAKKALEKAQKELGVLPEGFKEAFLAPVGGVDAHGKPVVTRNRKLADPKTGYPYEIWLKKPRIEFVLITSGTFMMGSPKGEGGRDPNEGPQHKVKITKPYYLAKYEVTQALWHEVMLDKPSRFENAGDNAPVEKVPWGECREFCKLLGLALPTEAQWEYAARAGTQTPFAFGRTVTVDQVNYNGNYAYGGSPLGLNRKTTVAVGSFPPNPWGLYEMHGNVWEWCEDVYLKSFYGRPEATKPDPVCASGADLRSARGGSWVGYPWYCRSAARIGYRPDNRAGYVGFRPMKVIEER